MKKQILIIALFAAASALAFGPPNGGMGRGTGMGMGPWWQNEKVVTELGLTPDQQARLGKTMLEHQEQAIDLRANLQKAELRLRELMDDQKFDERAALEQIDRVATARSAMEKSRAVLFVHLRSILTPEQWQKAKARLQEHRQERREGAREFREERWEHRGEGFRSGRGNGPTTPYPGPDAQ